MTMDLRPKYVIAPTRATFIRKGIDFRNRYYNSNLDRSDTAPLFILGGRRVQHTRCAHIAQGGCATSFQRSFQAPAGRCPWHPGVPPEGGLLWAEGWTRLLLRSPPTWDVLWSYVVETVLSADIRKQAWYVINLWNGSKTYWTYANIFHCRRYDPWNLLLSSHWPHEWFPHTYTTGDLAKTCAP